MTLILQNIKTFVFLLFGLVDYADNCKMTSCHTVKMISMKKCLTQSSNMTYFTGGELM